MKRILLFLSLMLVVIFFIYNQNAQVLAGDCDCYCVRHVGVVGCDTSDGPEGSIKCLSPNFCGGGSEDDGGGRGIQNPPPATQPTNTPTPMPTPTPTPIIIPVMGIKVGSLNTGINDESIVLSWQDLVPVKIKSKTMTSQITYMGVLFSDGFSLNTNSINFNAEKAKMETKSSSQKSLIQNIISSLFSILNPFSF